MKFFKKLSAVCAENSSIMSGGSPLESIAHIVHQIENHLFPIIRNATVLRVKESSRMHPDASFRSHFGGTPYFEAGDTWPEGPNGIPLKFIFQVFATPITQLPNGVQLLQFFSSGNMGSGLFNAQHCYVKTFKELSAKRQVVLSPPSLYTQAQYCEIAFEEAISLPDWEGLPLYRPAVIPLINQLNPEEPWELYEQFCEKLTGNCYYRTQLAGYPRWIKDDETPLNSQGKRVRLLFQSDSEENAGLMWGDMGLVYIFYDEADNRFWVKHQSHSC